MEKVFNVEIEKVQNGYIVSYREVGSYDDHKSIFPTFEVAMDFVKGLFNE